MNKADARKTVRDANAEVAKSAGDVAGTGRKIAHDASQPGGQPVRKVVEATSRDMTRKIDGAAEQNLRKAAEDLRGAVRDAGETAGNTADVARQASDQVVEQLGQVSTTQENAVKDVTGRTQQNLGNMMQTGVRLVDGYQAIMREWADYTRSAVQCNIDGMNSIMRARTPQDLIAAQSELLNAEVRVMLNSGVRISEATLRVVQDAARRNAERTRNQQNS
jgi:hypothetical protein